MEMNWKTGRAAKSLVVLLCAGTPLVGACKQTDYLARQDSITLGAGDAMAHNRAVHTIDPWPPYVGDTHLPADGDRMLLAVERYKVNRSLTPRGLTGGRAPAVTTSKASTDQDAPQ